MTTATSSYKVYISAFIYTVLITVACYCMKAYDGLSAEKTSKSKSDIVQSVTSAYSNSSNVIKKKDRVKVVVEDGIYWSAELENLLPQGISSDEAHDFFHSVTTKRVTQARPAGNRTCSNTTPQNKYVVLENNVTMCARSRRHCWPCLEGEVISYHISRLLGIDNVPPVKMTTYDVNNEVWLDFPKLDRWNNGDRVTMSMWINELGPAISIPELLLKHLKKNTTLTSKDKTLQRLPKQELLNLMQLSDMFIFDFMVFHGDRILRNKIQSEKPMKWYSVTMESDHQRLTLQSPIKNLCIQKQTNKFWFIDNEMTFEALSPKVQKHLNFNENILKSMCIFRKSTIAHVKKMLARGNPVKMLYRTLRRSDPVFLIMLNRQRQTLFVEELNQKLMTQINKLVLWVEHCKEMLMQDKKGIIENGKKW